MESHNVMKFFASVKTTHIKFLLFISILCVSLLIIFTSYSKSDNVVTPEDGSVWINAARLSSVSQTVWIVTRQELWSWRASSHASMPGSSLPKESSSLHELIWPITDGLHGRVFWHVARNIRFIYEL